MHRPGHQQAAGYTDSTDSYTKQPTCMPCQYAGRFKRIHVLTKSIGEAAPAGTFLPERGCVADLKMQAALDCSL